MQLNWTAIMEPDCPQLAEVTDSGWTNEYIVKKWLETVFDPYTRDNTPAGMQRLLIMNGHEIHVQVDFLDSCWSRGINNLILPANMTSIFQPLDVAFCDQLKSVYHSKVQAQLLHFSSTLLSKGLFWRWHQKAWREMARSRNIRPAWRKARLWPLDQAIMEVENKHPSMLPTILPKQVPVTPTYICIGRTTL